MAHSHTFHRLSSCPLQLLLTSAAGPMIDRILCMCQTKVESLKWVEHFKQQIKVSRQSAVMQGSHPPPPPHVSANAQPFELLTSWIRDRLVSGSLGRTALRGLTQTESYSKKFQLDHNDNDTPVEMRHKKKEPEAKRQGPDTGLFLCTRARIARRLFQKISAKVTLSAN